MFGQFLAWLFGPLDEPAYRLISARAAILYHSAILAERNRRMPVVRASLEHEAEDIVVHATRFAEKLQQFLEDPHDPLWQTHVTALRVKARCLSAHYEQIDLLLSAIDFQECV